MDQERDLLSHVSETREALRLSREARKAFDENHGDLVLRANWILAKDAYFQAKQKLDAAIDDAIGLFKD